MTLHLLFLNLSLLLYLFSFKAKNNLIANYAHHHSFIYNSFPRFYAFTLLYLVIIYFKEKISKLYFTFNITYKLITFLKGNFYFYVFLLLI